MTDDLANIFVTWQMRWLRRVERASGDPVALGRLLDRRR